MCHLEALSPSRDELPAPPDSLRPQHQDGAGRLQAAPRVTSPLRPSRAGRRVRAAVPLKVSAAAPPAVPPGAVPVPVPVAVCGQEDMAALGRLSRLLLGAAAPRSLPARGLAAAAAHEEGGGNGALRGEAEPRQPVPLRAGALRCGNGA